MIISTDIAGLAGLGTDERAVGQVWHLPGPETLTTRAVLELLASEVGHPVPVRSVPKLLLRLFGLVLMATSKAVPAGPNDDSYFVVSGVLQFGHLRAPLDAIPGDRLRERTDLSPTEAWSQRVRRVGGFIQLAFAVFWLVRKGSSDQ